MIDRIKALEDALRKIRELNETGADENGHRWVNSDLIEQEIVFALAASQPAPALDVTGAAPDAHQIDLTTAGAQQAQPVAVKVKALVWDTVKAGDGSVWSVSVGLGLEYAVRIIPEIGWHWTKEYMPTWAPSESEEDAKAAAQADYEARILAALDVQPITVQDAARVPEVQAAFAALDAAQDGLHWAKAHLRSLAGTESIAVNEALEHVEHVLRAIAEGRA